MQSCFRITKCLTFKSLCEFCDKTLPVCLHNNLTNCFKYIFLDSNTKTDPWLWSLSPKGCQENVKFWHSIESLLGWKKRHRAPVMLDGMMYAPDWCDTPWAVSQNASRDQAFSQFVDGPIWRFVVDWYLDLIVFLQINGFVKFSARRNSDYDKRFLLISKPI